MPLFLVRWPNMSCALVRARRRTDLLDILDEQDNPDGVEITRYNGPVFLDFTLATDRPLPVRDGVSDDDRVPLTEHDIDVGDVQRLADGEFPAVRIPSTDTGSAMYKALLSGAFPHLHRALSAERDEDVESADVELVRAAAREEAMVLVRASWRWAGVVRSDDPVNEIAARLGTSPEHVRDLQRQAEEESE